MPFVIGLVVVIHISKMCQDQTMIFYLIWCTHRNGEVLQWVVQRRRFRYYVLQWVDQRTRNIHVLASRVRTAGALDLVWTISRVDLLGPSLKDARCWVYTNTRVRGANEFLPICRYVGSRFECMGEEIWMAQTTKRTAPRNLALFFFRDQLLPMITPPAIWKWWPSPRCGFSSGVYWKTCRLVTPRDLALPVVIFKTMCFAYAVYRRLEKWWASS